jgi:beta-glucosidase
MANNEFPEDFIWGAATASYQIEGAVNEDGRGPSIWDTFSHTPGKVDKGHTGDVACDHYHRWPEDIEIMKSLGLDAYRFSIAWPRIFPEGRGIVNEKGIDFYSRLVDGLLDAGITPFVTLYHWDLPQTLQDEGGWPVRSTAEAFVDYTDIVTRSLGDRVKYWATFNEPWVSAYIGYLEGRHAPGHKSMSEMVTASHHLMLAHGWAIPVIRRNSPGSETGIVLNLAVQMPASNSTPDRAAAWKGDGNLNRWFLDPLNGRGYPADMVATYGQDMSHVKPGDLDAMATPIDFLGINYYFRGLHRSDVPEDQNLPREVHLNQPPTEMGWEVYPEGLYETLARVWFDYRYPRKFFVTENGAAYQDAPSDGRVDDPQRVAYYRSHLASASRAVQAGVPLKGYFAWSLLDNFEWGYGYTKRFGIVYVDYESQQRIPKSGADYYRKVIEANAVV